MSHPGGGPIPPVWFPTIANFTPGSLSPGQQDELMLGMKDGHVFSINTKTFAVSELDDIPTDEAGLWSVNSFNAQRFATYDVSDVNTNIAYWGSDSETPPDSPVTSALIEGSIWDFDLPEQRKILDGVHVHCDIPIGAQSCTVSYSVDGATYIQITPSITSTATSTKHYLPISVDEATTVTFSNLQLRTSIAGGLKVYSVTSKARIPDFDETWELLVKLQDDKPGQRPSNRQDKADVKRQFLWDTYRAKQVTTYEDGYVSDRTGAQATPASGFATYAVTIDELKDFVDRKGEGKARIMVRRVLTEVEGGS